MTEKLELDTYQASKVKDLNLNLAANMKAIKAKYEGDRKAARTEVKALRDGHKLAMQEVLTEEQFAKFAARAKKNRDGKRGKKGGERGK